MTNCYAEENQAQFGGGGIFVETSTAMLKSSTFNDHHSEVGAALYLINSIVDASYCNYNGNGIDPQLSDSMTYTGGVMYLSSSSNLRSSYSTFNNNAVS